MCIFQAVIYNNDNSFLTNQILIEVYLLCYTTFIIIIYVRFCLLIIYDSTLFLHTSWVSKNYQILYSFEPNYNMIARTPLKKKKKSFDKYDC